MHKIYLTIAFFTIFTLYVNAQKEKDPNFHIYVLMGQSNMSGRAKMTEEFRNEGHPRVFMLNKDDQWELAKHPLHFDKQSITGVGPGLSFGIEMAKMDPNSKIGLIPTAVGGTSIDHWKPGAFDKRTKTYPYDDALARVEKAMKSGVIKGVLWHQGEADRDPEEASSYISKLITLIEYIRTKADNHELPFVAGELGRFVPKNENINNELAKLPEKIPHTAVVSSEGLEHKGDGTHFANHSAAKLGVRFAEKMQEIQNKLKTENIVRKVANNVIENMSFQFADPETGKKYESAKGVKLTPEIEIANWSNTLNYVNGILTSGLVQVSDVLDDKKYTDYSRKNFKFIFDNLPYFEHFHKANVDEDYAFRRFYDMEYRDACCAIAAGITDVGELAKQTEFRKYLDRSTDFIFDTHNRLSDGTLARTFPHDMTVWADDLYMSVPFLARMGKMTGDNKYFDEAIKQVENYNKYLYDPMSGLYFHSWYSDVEMNGVAHWGRSNGWLAVAQTELLNYLPEDHPKRSKLIKLLLRQIVGYSRYQHQSGLWHQILDKSDSYLETSVTAMFIYAVARAVNQGWIPPMYFTVAERGWEGLASKITPEGKVEDVCIGTGISEDINFYYTRPTRLNGSHALGAVLLAGSEMVRGYNLQHQTTVKGGGY